MSLIRVGSNSRYAKGWDAIFSAGGKGAKSSKISKTAKTSKGAPKKSASPKKKAKRK